MASVNLPKGRDLGTELSSTLSAQLGILPNMLAAQAQYAPLQASAQLGQLSTMLLGTPGGNVDTQVYRPAVYVDGSGKYSYGALPKGITAQIQYPDLPDARTTGGGGGGGMGGINPGSIMDFGVSGDPILGGLFGLGGGKGKGKRLVSAGGYTTVSKTLGAQRGLLDIYSKDVAPALGDLTRSETSKTRGSDIRDITQMGPEAIQALMQSDPELAKLVNGITAQAGSDVGAGTYLTPAQLRMAQQSVRSRQTGMLGGTGSAGDLGEAIGVSAYGQQLRQQRLANASGAAGLRQSIYQNPMLSFLGRNTNPLPGTQGAVGQAMGIGASGTNYSNLLNPESSYAQDIYSTNFNALVNGSIANANNSNALIGAGISAVGSLAGGAMGAI